MKAVRMATLFDGISQQLDFKREEGGSSSDNNSSDDYTSRTRRPKIASPRIRSPTYGSPGSACRTPRAQRHRSRSRTMGSPLQCVSPIPYAAWKKLRLCDSPSTPKVRPLQMTPPPPYLPPSYLNLNMYFPPLEPALQVIPTFLHNQDARLSENSGFRFRC